MSDVRAVLAPILALPRAEQPAAVEALLAAWPSDADEAWNTAFGADSLYHAFTRSTVAQGVHGANRDVLRPLLDARPGWRVIDVGGGDGALWAGLLRDDDVGELVVVDPHPEGPAAVAAVAPPGVRVIAMPSRVEAVGLLPHADAVVCSLMLHHVAGADAAERAAVGLSGPGKREVLELFRAAIRPRAGVLLLNEADIYCDVGLPPGDPVLRDRLCDSYVRRFAVSIAEDLATRDDVDDGVRARWRAIVRDWSLAQVRVADVPLAERDVYELDVVSWTRLLTTAGLTLRSRRGTDAWGLFFQYVAG